MDIDLSEQNTEPASTIILSAQGHNQGQQKWLCTLGLGCSPQDLLALTGNRRSLEPSSTHVNHRPQTSLCSLLIVNICSAQLWIMVWHTKKSPTDSKGCWVCVFLFFFSFWSLAPRLRFAFFWKMPLKWNSGWVGKADGAGYSFLKSGGQINGSWDKTLFSNIGEKWSTSPLVEVASCMRGSCDPSDCLTHAKYNKPQISQP